MPLYIPFTLIPFRENNNVIVFPISFHIVMPLTNPWLIRLQGQFPILKTRSCLDLYPLIRPARRSLVLGRGRFLIPGFIRSHSTLAVYDVAHSLPLGGVDGVFPSLRMRPEGISHTPLVLLESSDGSERSMEKKNTAPWWFEKQNNVLGAKERKLKIEKDGNYSLSI